MLLLSLSCHSIFPHFTTLFTEAFLSGCKCFFFERMPTLILNNFEVIAEDQPSKTSQFFDVLISSSFVPDIFSTILDYVVIRNDQHFLPKSLNLVTFSPNSASMMALLQFTLQTRVILKKENRITPLFLFKLFEKCWVLGMTYKDIIPVLQEKQLYKLKTDEFSWTHQRSEGTRQIDILVSEEIGHPERYRPEFALLEQKPIDSF